MENNNLDIEKEIMNNDNPESWSKYKMYVTEYLKVIDKKMDQLEKDVIKDRFDCNDGNFNLKSELKQDLAEITKDIIKIQVRNSVINFILTLLTTSIISTLMYLLINKIFGN